MKNKIVTIILSILLVVSLGANVFLYMSTSKTTENLSALTNTKEELASEIETKTTELNSLTSDIEALNAKILELTDSVDSLTTENNDIKSKIEADSTGSSDYIEDELTITDTKPTLDERAKFIQSMVEKGYITQEEADDMMRRQEEIDRQEEEQQNQPSNPGHIDVDVPGVSEDTDPVDDYTGIDDVELPPELWGDPFH